MNLSAHSCYRPAGPATIVATGPALRSRMESAMTPTTSAATPREVFAHMQRSWLAKSDHATDPLADDVVIEMPFARPGRPRRIEGRDQVLALFGPERAAFPVRFDEA